MKYGNTKCQIQIKNKLTSFANLRAILVFTKKTEMYKQNYALFAIVSIYMYSCAIMISYNRFRLNYQNGLPFLPSLLSERRNLRVYLPRSAFEIYKTGRISIPWHRLITFLKQHNIQRRGLTLRI